MLGALSMVKNKNNCSWPPTFDIENRRLSVKKNCSNFFHGDLGILETNFFVCCLLLLASNKKNYLGHA
jgi:hypothetical protein